MKSVASNYYTISVAARNKRHFILDSALLSKRKQPSGPSSQLVEDTDRYERLMVTRNLEAALRQLRSQNKIRNMWIDAICINQKIDEEKSVQIQRMGQIYSMASRVIVWLGRLCEPIDVSYGLKTDDIQGGFRYLRELKERVHRNRLKWSDALKDKGSVPNGEVSRVLEAICRRPWFSRVWVQQEHILAQAPVTMYCGPETIGLDDFGTTIRFIIDQFELHGPRVPPSLYCAATTINYNGLFRRRHFVRKAASAKLLIALMHTSGFVRATEAKDKVFGLLGLIHENGKAPYLRPDCGKPSEQFFLEFARNIITDTGSLAALQGVGPPSGTQPSWVPEWNLVCGPSFDQHQDFQEYTSFNFSADGRVLHTKGVALGEIIFSYRVFGDAETDLNNSQAMLEDRKHPLRTESIFQRGECNLGPEENSSFLASRIEQSRILY